jgi:hypothetical protein
LSSDKVGRITFLKKLDKTCPHFERMHKIFGDRANVEPPATVNSGFGDDTIHNPVHAEDDYSDGEMTGIDGLPAPDHPDYNCNSKSEEEEDGNLFDEGVDYEVNETPVELPGESECVPIADSQTPFSVGDFTFLDNVAHMEDTTTFSADPYASSATPTFAATFASSANPPVSTNPPASRKNPPASATPIFAATPTPSATPA